MRPKSLIAIFAQHKVAANLLMAVMIMVGFWSLSQLNTQFLPNYSLKLITINIVWPGASAEDVERSITNPIEKELSDIDHVKKMTSTSRPSNTSIVIEFKKDTDMGRALEEVREQISQIRNLPTAAEPPTITRKEVFEPIAKLIITGPNNLEELRPLIRNMERELLNRGIAKVEVSGLPDQEIAIQIPILRLNELHLSLSQIANIINQRSQDLPAGMVGKASTGRQLRSLAQRRSIKGFEQLPILTDAQGQLLRLKDIATIDLRGQDAEVKVSSDGKPAVELTLLRTENANALTAAKILENWLAEIKPQLGSQIHIKVYNELWLLIKERINLLLYNGAGGLLLILIILFLFLNDRVAFWVSMGIPASFMAALGVLYLTGDSINMVSLFAFIMALGIIVDDTIVIGEETLTNYSKGQPPLDAVKNAAGKMLAPIMASSLTTICAFIPLMLVSNTIGQIIFSIPVVVICVIIASVIECFLVLPGHLHHSLKKHLPKPPTGLKKRVLERFDYFREHSFKRFVIYALQHRLITIASALGIFIVCLGLIIGGYINFNFFPSPEGKIIYANAHFSAGTPSKTVESFLKKVRLAALETNKAFSSNDDSILQIDVSFLNKTSASGQQASNEQGENYASVAVELTSPDQRKISNKQFIAAWRQRIKLPPSMENFTIIAPRGGPPGKDIDIQLSEGNARVLKQASLELQEALATYPGVSDISDNMPFSQDQLIYQLTPTGKSIGLTINEVGKQLRAAFNGEIAQIFHLPNEEIEVRVMLPDTERDSIASLEQFPIITPNGENIPLGTVVNLDYHSSTDILRHTNTKLTVNVNAEVDAKVTNSNKILASLLKEILPKLQQRYNVKASFEGRAEEQQETFKDLKYGLMLAFALIYIILAWVFSSYGWPLVVMCVIPLGLTGAIIGHMLMGIDLTILSLFGLFGLSGIVVNDSIILVNEYKHLREAGMPINEAIVQASCKRLRAVLLTSLTTIAGLTPLLFETSLQAQFLIPMANAIAFGLAYATLLILVVVPALLSLYETLIGNHHTIN